MVRDLSSAELPMLASNWLPHLRTVLDFGILVYHIINPDLLLSVAQHMKDLKNKKITKSRKKRKQNTEDEGRERHRELRERSALTSGRLHC